jgi:hypothetical protein
MIGLVTHYHFVTTRGWSNIEHPGSDVVGSIVITNVRYALNRTWNFRTVRFLTEHRPNCLLTVIVLVSLCKSIDMTRVLEWRCAVFPKGCLSILFMWELRWLQQPYSALLCSALYDVTDAITFSGVRNKTSEHPQWFIFQCNLYRKINYFVSYGH